MTVIATHVILSREAGEGSPASSSAASFRGGFVAVYAARNDIRYARNDSSRTFSNIPGV